jgi:8-oxo-dGTP diphosphatase
MKKKVATLVVVDENKFLILQRSKTSTGAGLWNFPGGSVDPEEDFPEAAVRELKEEADLNVDMNNIKYIGTLDSKYLHVKFFITNKFSGEVTINKESQSFKWIQIKDIEKYRFVSGGALHPDLVFEIGKFIYGGKDGG